MFEEVKQSASYSVLDSFLGCPGSILTDGDGSKRHFLGAPKTMRTELQDLSQNGNGDSDDGRGRCDNTSTPPLGRSLYAATALDQHAYTNAAQQITNSR